MFSASFVELVFVAVVGAAVAVAALIVAAAYFGPSQHTARRLRSEMDDGVAFLFDGPDLISATDTARRILEHGGGKGEDWDRVLSILRPSFPGLSARLSNLAELRSVHVPARPGSGHAALVADWSEGMVRLTLVEDDDPAPQTDAIAIAAMEDELATLRTMAEDTPQLIWKLDDAGQITWANRAYLDHASDGSGPTMASWPPRNIFPQITGAPLHGEPTRRRVSRQTADNSEIDWFEVTSLRRGTESVHFASDANGLVRAEQAQREFVQTLTRTFADLHAGLMIFDKHRRLVLFNPAFLDMSDLPVEFLSSRPVIHSVLDRMREARMLPEPKDYSSWRDHMIALQTKAENGTYSEVWTLPGDQIYRVTGRPHPNGAIAFLFEDISAEMSLTRRFRSELEFGQAVIDNIAEAVSVFSASGGQVAVNMPYCKLWEIEQPEPGLEEQTFDEALEIWRDMTAPTPAWSDLRKSVKDPSSRTEWNETVQLLDGRSVACRFLPLNGGATMVSFRVQDTAVRPSAASDPVPIGLARKQV